MKINKYKNEWRRTERKVSKKKISWTTNQQNEKKNKTFIRKQFERIFFIFLNVMLKDEIEYKIRII